MFKQDLLGRDLIQLKRDAENTLGYQPLTITGKIKVGISQENVKFTSILLTFSSDS